MCDYAPNRICNEPGFRDIVWFFGETWAVSRRQLAKVRRSIIFYKGIPDFVKKASNGPGLLVINDLLK